MNASPQPPTIAQLRARIATVEGGRREAKGDHGDCSDAGSVLPVSDAIAVLLPGGGLPRGTVVSVSGAGSLLASLLASVTATGAAAAVVGRPRLGLLAVAEMGGDLTRLALIPDPGSNPVEIAAILLDGLDLVVLDLCGHSVPPSRTRALVARARSKGCVLLITDGEWEPTHIRLDARVDGYRGHRGELHPGRGRIHTLSLTVRAHGRGFQPRHTRLEVCHREGRTHLIAPTPEVGQLRVSV